MSVVGCDIVDRDVVWEEVGEEEAGEEVDYGYCCLFFMHYRYCLSCYG